MAEVTVIGVRRFKINGLIREHVFPLVIRGPKAEAILAARSAIDALSMQECLRALLNEDHPPAFRDEMTSLLRERYTEDTALRPALRFVEGLRAEREGRPAVGGAYPARLLETYLRWWEEQPQRRPLMKEMAQQFAVACRLLGLLSEAGEWEALASL